MSSQIQKSVEVKEKIPLLESETDFDFSTKDEKLPSYFKNIEYSSTNDGKNGKI